MSDEHGMIDSAGELDAALLRGLTQARVSRRQALKGAVAVAAGAGVASALSACGVGGTRDTGWSPGFAWKDWWAQQRKAGVLDWANWPLYIDTSHGKHPSLELFTKQTGIEVNYRPVIQDNPTFFAQISPVLQAGQINRLRPDRDHRRLGADPADRRIAG